MFSLYLFLLSLTACTWARTLSSAHAQAVIKAATGHQPEIVQFCDLIGKPTTDCANTFFTGNRERWIGATMAATNCLAQIEASAEHTRLILTALNANVDDLAKYSSPSHKTPQKKRDENGNVYYEDASPSDREKAAKENKEREIKKAGENYDMMVRVVGLCVEGTVAIIASKIPGGNTAAKLISPPIAGFAGGLVEGAILGPKDEYVEKKGDRAFVDAYNDPEGHGAKLTGTCEVKEQQCRDADGLPYKDNPHYDSGEGMSGDNHDDDDDNNDPFDSDLDVGADPGTESPGGDDTGDNQAPIDELDKEITVDPNSDPEAYMRQCTSKE